MDHPLQEDLSHLKDAEIEAKIQDLSKKYHIAYRMGNKDLLTQVDIFAKIYKEELMKRYNERVKKDFDGDLDQLINVD
jgi:hypothetical protein